MTPLSPPSFLLLCHCIVPIPHRWDLALTLIILQTCFTVPIRVAFPNEPSDCNRNFLGQVLHTSQILVVCGRCFSPVRFRKFWRTGTLAKYLFRVCPSDCERAFVRAHSSLIPFRLSTAGNDVVRRCRARPHFQPRCPPQFPHRLHQTRYLNLDVVLAHSNIESSKSTTPLLIPEAL